MEKIILGMLMVRGMTIYEIKNFINNNLDTMCSASSGSIHTAVKKMLEKEIIKVYEEGNKKIYYITAKGREEFNLWIEQPMDIGKAKNIELSKLFFLGLSNPDKRVKLIEKYIDELKTERNKLLVIYKNTKVNTDEIISSGMNTIIENQWNEEGVKKNLYTGKIMDTVSDIYKFQKATLQYGMASIEFEIAWYTNYLNEMKVQ
ncbi:MAG: PadR family transcriptional regulator [Clostridium sp.]|nr:PadR family transcriptional regulator [Clostridium sp.]MDU7084888.1 PadR family transcriptional regulator [Clostridium sp.]